MRILYWIVFVIVVALSVAAGGAKLAQVPQEAAFFESIGLSTGWMIALGIVQTLGAILALIPKSRKLGLSAIAIGFLASSAMIFATGNNQFGSASLIPVALILFLIWQLRYPAR